jgi:hypothetical protein
MERARDYIAFWSLRPRRFFITPFKRFFPRGRDKPPADAYTETRIFSAPGGPT